MQSQAQVKQGTIQENASLNETDSLFEVAQIIIFMLAAHINRI